MTEQREDNPAVSAFAAHVQAFHRSLPTDEQHLLEQIFALAEEALAAKGADAEASGYMLGAAFGPLLGILATAPPIATSGDARRRHYVKPSEA